MKIPAFLEGRWSVRVTSGQLRSLLRGLIKRIEVSNERIYLIMNGPEFERLLNWDCIGLFRSPADKGGRNTFLIELPYTKRIRRLTPIDLAAGPPGKGVHKPNPSLIALMDEARRAREFFEIHRGEEPPELAARLRRDQQYFKKLLMLTYLAPDIVVAIRDGNQPHSLKRKHLINTILPLDWELQRKLLGFADPNE